MSTAAEHAPLLCGIGDEAAPGIEAQVRIHGELDLPGLELRTVGGRWIHELNPGELALVGDLIGAAHLAVPVVDTPVGGWSVDVATPLDAELRTLAVSAERAATLGCSRLRVMSYPNDGRAERDWADEALRRMRALAREAERASVVLLHENCVGWGSQGAEQSLRMLDQVGSEHLRLLFDIGNGVWYGYDGPSFLEEVLPHVDHVHVKDGLRDVDDKPVASEPGAGAAGLVASLALLRDAGYRGWYSVEPHLVNMLHLNVSGDDEALERSYADYVTALRGLLRRVLPNPSTSLSTDSSLRCLAAEDIGFLLDLMRVPTVSPLEGGDPEATARAQELLVAGAVARGFKVLAHAAPPAAALEGPEVPLPVREFFAADPALLRSQPSVVLALGEAASERRRLVINFHIDTVGPHLEPRLADGTLWGRGAVDAKGPGVAALAGVAAAFAQAPWLNDTVQARVVSVPGEEGGAIGVFGTRWLVDGGHVGRLMVFAEPTGGLAMDSCTASMTLEVRVDGKDSTDDFPDQGHNATVGLGFVAACLARDLGPLADRGRAKVTIAGLRTGPAHNRVYGRGRLLVNIAYPDAATAAELARGAAAALTRARAAFQDEYAGNPLTARLVRDWEHVVSAVWLKQGLPALANRDPAMEELLRSAGFRRHDPDVDGPSFTCDAIWAGGPGRHVVVCGPGRLDTNGAHTDGEHVAIAKLEMYAAGIRDTVVRFGEHVRAGH